MKTLLLALSAIILIGCSKEKTNTLRVKYTPTGKISNFHMEADDKPLTVKNNGVDHKRPIIGKTVKIEFSSYSPGVYRDSIIIYYNDNIVYSDYVMDLKKEITLQ